METLTSSDTFVYGKKDKTEAGSPWLELQYLSMTTLKKYDSLDSLKLDNQSSSDSIEQVAHRHLEMERFLELLRNTLLEKKGLEKKTSKHPRQNAE